MSDDFPEKTFIVPFGRALGVIAAHRATPGHTPAVGALDLDMESDGAVLLDRRVGRGPEVQFHAGAGNEPPFPKDKVVAVVRLFPFLTGFDDVNPAVEKMGGFFYRA